MRVPKVARRLVSSVARSVAPVWWKERHELQYWQGKADEEGGNLSNDHYEYFYTRHFGIDRSHYEDTCILDIGCGPRGSLEWAPASARTLGLDPLAKEYLRLGADRHRMEYLAAPSEQIPLPDGTCDAVFSFNSLDHVHDVEKTAEEIKRVTRDQGLFLLLVEVNHPPTACEPHSLSPAGILELFAPEFRAEEVAVYLPAPDGKGIYQAIRADRTVDGPEETSVLGYLSAKFRKGA
jgi:SAM-dependent methyltransferase